MRKGWAVSLFLEKTSDFLIPVIEKKAKALNERETP